MVSVAKRKRLKEKPRLEFSRWDRDEIVGYYWVLILAGD